MRIAIHYTESSIAWINKDITLRKVGTLSSHSSGVSYKSSIIVLTIIQDATWLQKMPEDFLSQMKIAKFSLLWRGLKKTQNKATSDYSLHTQKNSIKQSDNRYQWLVKQNGTTKKANELVTEKNRSGSQLSLFPFLSLIHSCRSDWLQNEDNSQRTLHRITARHTQLLVFQKACHQQSSNFLNWMISRKFHWQNISLLFTISFSGSQKF